MKSVKEKVSNAASSGKAHVDVYKAKAEEKVEKAAARTEEEREIAHQRRKAKEAEAKMEMHMAKADHAAEKLQAKQSHLYGHHHPTTHTHTHTHQQPMMSTTGTTHPYGSTEGQPVGTAVPMAGATAPTYPLGGQGHLHHHNKHM